jgi:hypothetical protein
MIDGSISPIKKLKKKFIYKLLKLNNLNSSMLDNHIELNGLSLKKELDIVKLLDYFNSI